MVLTLRFYTGLTMSCVFLTHQGAKLSQENHRLLVKDGDEIIQQIPIHHLSSVCIFGHIHLTISAIELLLQNQIEVAFFTIHGKLKGKLSPPLSNNALLRIKQYQQIHNQRFKIDLARSIVHSKLTNGKQFILQGLYNHPGKISTDLLDDLTDMIHRCRFAESLPSLRGIEGAGSRAYFAALARLNRSRLPFTGRSSHPPRDPVNALLSLSYVMFNTMLTGLLEIAGLDPYLGFYHEPINGRPSLALDMLEEFRHSLIDRFCFAMINRRVFVPEDFQQHPQYPQGYVLKRASLKKFLSRYATWLQKPISTGKLAPLEIVRQQVQKLKHAIKNDQPYSPYLYPQTRQAR